MLALFVALGGSSYAVTRIGSKQIANNSVRSKDLRNNDVRSRDVRNRSLLSKDFKAGQLPRGAVGPTGRSALSPLKSGETIRGAWALRGDPIASGSIEVAGVTLPIPAPLAVDSLHVVFSGNDPITGDGCTGNAAEPVAGPGFVCVYAAALAGTTSAGGFGARAPSIASSGATGDGSPYGFTIVVNGNVSNWFADGTWAYRAP